jgi:hypothetical protein
MTASIAPNKPREIKQRYRFRHLVEKGIVDSRDTLDSWIRTRGFPPGKLITKRCRTWTADEVEDWFERQGAA